jgi:hypothetical protein
MRVAANKQAKVLIPTISSVPDKKKNVEWCVKWGCNNAVILGKKIIGKWKSSRLS